MNGMRPQNRSRVDEEGHQRYEAERPPTPGLPGSVTDIGGRASGTSGHLTGQGRGGEALISCAGTADIDPRDQHPLWLAGVAKQGDRTRTGTPYR